MLRNAFLKGLRDQARPLLMWVVGVAFYVGLLMSIYPSIRGSANSLQGYIDNLPAAVRAAFLGPGGDFSTPVGYVNTELLSWLAPIVLIAFAISVAARSLAGEEEGGTLSLLLANTVGRRRLVLQKFAAMLVAVGVLGAAFWLSLWIATAIAGTPVGAGDLAGAMLRLTLLGLAVGSVTYAVGGATGRRQTGIAAGAGVGLVMYVANTVSVMNTTLKPLRYVSLFHYSGGAAPLGQSLSAEGLLVLIATSALLLVATVWLFQRRDVRV